MINDIKISIVMPIYNSQLFLEDSLQSIQNQTFDDYEVLMVNDGSTDASLEIMKKYSRADSRFISYSKKMRAFLRQGIMHWIRLKGNTLHFWIVMI